MILIELNFLCGGIHMDFDQIITSRRSIRFFSSKPVATDLLTEILTLANYAPSWSDSQPWRVYLAQGETLAKIKAAHQKATAAKLATSPTLAAKSRGVDSIIAYELIKYTDQLKATLQIPASENLIAGIALGYRDSHALNDYQSPRRPLAEFVHTFD